MIGQPKGRSLLVRCRKPQPSCVNMMSVDLAESFDINILTSCDDDSQSDGNSDGDEKKKKHDD